MLLESKIGVNESSEHPSNTSMNSDILDLEVLKTFERVKSDDGLDIVVELIDLYLHNTTQRIRELADAAFAEDWLSVKHLAHTLKGSSSTLGLHRMARLCQQLENADMNSDKVADEFVQLLETEFTKAREGLITERERRTAI